MTYSQSVQACHDVALMMIDAQDFDFSIGVYPDSPMVDSFNESSTLAAWHSP